MVSIANTAYFNSLLATLNARTHLRQTRHGSTTPMDLKSATIASFGHAPQTTLVDEEQGLASNTSSMVNVMICLLASYMLTTWYT